MELPEIQFLPESLALNSGQDLRLAPKEAENHDPLLCLTEIRNSVTRCVNGKLMK